MHGVGQFRQSRWHLLRDQTANRLPNSRQPLPSRATQPVSADLQSSDLRRLQAWEPASSAMCLQGLQGLGSATGQPTVKRRQMGPVRERRSSSPSCLGA